MTRGIAVSTASSLRSVKSFVAKVRRVDFFKSEMKSGGKFHLTIGSTTVHATVSFFGAGEVARDRAKHGGGEEVSVLGIRRRGAGPGTFTPGVSAVPASKFDSNAPHEHHPLMRRRYTCFEAS